MRGCYVRSERSPSFGPDGGARPRKARPQSQDHSGRESAWSVPLVCNGAAAESPQGDPVRLHSRWPSASLTRFVGGRVWRVLDAWADRYALGPQVGRRAHEAVPRVCVGCVGKGPHPRKYHVLRRGCSSPNSQSKQRCACGVGAQGISRRRLPGLPRAISVPLPRMLFSAET